MSCRKTFWYDENSLSSVAQATLSWTKIFAIALPSPFREW